MRRFEENCTRMPAGRPKYNFYAVTNGKEIGIYTNWTQASDSVLGFANARYKGYITYSEAKLAMESAGIVEFLVFDGLQTVTKSEYEKQLTSEGKSGSDSTIQKDTSSNNDALVEVIYEDNVKEATAVYIDGSCIKNGTNSAKAGYGLYWGIDHPWNGSYSMSTEEGATNNKAELRAAIKAIEIARDNGLERLVINSDSKYVILGATHWSDNWCNNGWKTSNGDSVKNEEEWKQLLQLVNESNISITWNHVPGHKGVSGNEEADKLAVRGANSQEKNQKCSEETQIENLPVSKVQQKVIVIGKLPNNQRNDTKAAADPLNSTPKRKLVKDNSDTPVPGCINGSFFDKCTTRANDSKNNGKDNRTSLAENDQLTQVMKNMETVLETVLFGLNQSREENFKFQKDVTKRLEEITSKQLAFAESLSNISKDLGAETRNANSRMEIVQASISMEDNLKLNQDVSRKLDEISSKQQRFAESQSTVIKELSSDKRNVNCRLDGLKSSLHTVETSCLDLKRNLEKASTSNEKECNEIQSVGRKIYEAITEVRNESKRTREQVGDIEKSISAISEAGMFSTTTKPKKTKDNTVNDNTVSRSQPNADSHSQNTMDTEEVEVLLVEVDTKEKENSQNNTNSVQATETPVSNQAENGKGQHQGKPGNKKDKVCLIGDSIAGQINIPLLGKTTNTYVRRLRAPKIDDVGTYTDEVKDSKLIIIHTGINNLRDKDSTESCVNSMVTAITSLRESAKDAKIVMSKIAPVGDRELAIEGIMLNASCEKKLREIHKDIQFLDHSNLAEQGRPIKTFYRPDMLHLSYNGVNSFSTNLRRVIDELLNHKEKVDKSQENDIPYRGRSAVHGRKYWHEDRRRPDIPDADHHRRDYDKSDIYHNRFSQYKGRRTDSDRRDYGSERDYYYQDRQQRYDERYDDNLSREDRSGGHVYRDNGYSYHRQYDRDYYRR
ncbi:MAG: viroplasmin family protein [Candidatus Thiodiazotropha sp.]